MSRWNKVKWLLITVLVVAVYWWAVTGIDFNLQRIIAGLPKGKIILERIFIKSLKYINSPFFWEMVMEMLKTLAMAYFGTFIASVLTVPFAFLAAVNFSPYARFFKMLLNFIRTFPEILLAIIFVSMVGPGPFAGVLAIGFHSVGMLGKLYAEAVENIDMKPIEAITASGGNFWQKLVFGVLPQVFPYFASYSIYRFEIAVRSASTVGLVGAGGIGVPLLLKVQGRNWEQVGVIIIVIIVTVVIVDYLSAYIRKKIV